MFTVSVRINNGRPTVSTVDRSAVACARQICLSETLPDFRGAFAFDMLPKFADRRQGHWFASCNSIGDENIPFLPGEIIRGIRCKLQQTILRRVLTFGAGGDRPMTRGVEIRVSGCVSQATEYGV